MPATAAPLSFRQELSAGHVLVMQCGARAGRFLERAAAAPGGRDARADREALRMAALAARLMENVGRGIVLAGAGYNPVAAAPEPAPAAPAPKLHAAPGASRGRLKNGNPCGDYLRAPRCGARTRAGCACRQPAMANGRCRLHGGKSTGPRTAAGLRRCRAARLVHGYRTAELISLRSRAGHAARRLRVLNHGAAAARRAAGHGLHRSDRLHRMGAEPQRRGVRPADRACPGAEPPLAPPRPCGDLSAGHGLHRPNLISRGWRTARRWLQEHAMPRLAARPR